MRQFFGTLIVSALCLAGWGVEALSGQQGSAIPAPSEGSSMTPAAFEALFHARAESALSRFSEADVHFFRMMIPHHGQALEMSALALDRTENAAILTLATRIMGGQEEEVARMRQWLQLRGLSEVESAAVPGAIDLAPAPASGHDHVMHDMPAGDTPVHDMVQMGPEDHSMPGLLTPVQMDELARASGADFDRLYLSYMIYHHQGAIQMVEELFATEDGGKEEEVFLFAAEIRTDQNTEVARMERLLATFQDRVSAP